MPSVNSTVPHQSALIDAVAQTAAAWRDPDHPARTEAVAATLEAPNRFTEPAIAFAINQQMDQLDAEALHAWSGGHWTETPRTVGVLNAGNIPLVGLQDLLATILTGHHYLGTTSSKSPYLLPAFVASTKEREATLSASFETAETLFPHADALMATGDDETMSWAASQCEAHGIPSGRRLLRGHRFSVAVIDGQEDEDEREDLAEDALLHEGYGCRNVAIVWAPRELAPDPYLEAFALFRGLFPVHPEMPGTLQMQQAFLEATDQSHAYGEGLEFLVSRGVPEPQRPGHVRWTEYDTLDDVRDWMAAHDDRIQLVTARSQIADQLADSSAPVAPLGTAQRPALDWQPDGQDTIAFLAALS
jgi:hypothetical protein